MDIEKIWQESEGKDNNLDKLLRAGKITRISSRHPIKKLQDNLLYGLILALMITAGYGFLFVEFSPWQIRVALVVVTVYNLIIMADSWRLYLLTRKTESINEPLRDKLQTVYDQYMRWWHIQLRTSLFVLPFAITGGFILGGIDGSGKTVEEFISHPVALIALGICLLVFIPASYFLSKWLFRVFYGKYLKQIKGSIDELS